MRNALQTVKCVRIWQSLESLLIHHVLHTWKPVVPLAATENIMLIIPPWIFFETVAKGEISGREKHMVVRVVPERPGLWTTPLKSAQLGLIKLEELM